MRDHYEMNKNENISTFPTVQYNTRSQRSHSQNRQEKASLT